MAHIIAFKPCSQKSSASSGPMARAASAEIVIFPGIRYEHWDAAPAVETKPKKKRKRDMIELCD